MIFAKEATIDPLKRFILAAMLLLLLAVILRLFLAFRQIRRNRQRGSVAGRKMKPVTTLIVLGSGGHTTEMLSMTRHLNSAHYHTIHYCKASTDSTSRDRLYTMIQGYNNNNAAKGDLLHIHDIPRSREVGQSFFSSFFSTVHAFFFAFILVGRLRPELVLCNGPGTCIPICFAALIYRTLGVCSSNIVFIESFCRVQTLSLTGKLLYFVTDLFVVHWKELHEKYPDSMLTSSFIQE